MLFARWRYHIRFASGFAYAPFNATSLGNGNENFKVIQNPGFLPDHRQN